MTETAQFNLYIENKISDNLSRMSSEQSVQDTSRACIATKAKLVAVSKGVFIYTNHELDGRSYKVFGDNMVC